MSTHRLIACPVCGWTVAVRVGLRLVKMRRCYICTCKQRFEEVL